MDKEERGFRENEALREAEMDKEKGIFRQRIRIRNADVGPDRCWRLSALMTVLQETAIAHTELLGAGREKTLDKGLLWVVTQQHLQISRLPLYGEELTVLTWPGTMLHLYFPRFWQILDSAGNICIEASMLWLLLEEESRNLVFPEEHGIEIPGVSYGSGIPLPRRVRFSAAGKLGSFSVPRSFLDMNGHMNNTRYYDLLEDHLPKEFEGQRLAGIETDFLKECREGEEMSLLGKASDGHWYFSGETKKPVFRMEAAFSEK